MVQNQGCYEWTSLGHEYDNVIEVIQSLEILVYPSSLGLTSSARLWASHIPGINPPGSLTIHSVADGCPAALEQH